MDSMSRTRITHAAHSDLTRSLDLLPNFATPHNCLVSLILEKKCLVSPVQSFTQGSAAGHKPLMADPSPNSRLSNNFLKRNQSSGHEVQIMVLPLPERCMKNAINFIHLDASAAPRAADDAASADPITRWPMFAYLCGAMVCLLTSSACHLVLCHSERMAYVTLRLDYAGIAALIVTSFYPVVYYSFLCHPGLQRLYMGFITAFGAAAVTASLVPVFQAPEFRLLRAGLFSCMGVSGLIPVAHKLVLYGGRREAAVTACYEALMGALYGLGAAVYAARMPERWFPGRFDLVGHSHQLFHLFVIAGAYAHYLGGVEYLKWRDADRCW
ncbi:heptahelical transmembrane protein 4 isoform X2 [Triticum aestivum]|uniref:heptahelical transmembrane protein 4 isoform X2 n=2 Tax=Triticum aestivum TaxID=4565 RepID=UPI001D023FA3|nr:heptahelical transmembrane protein 4-like isoform X2 [Triticum aestivum]